MTRFSASLAYICFVTGFSHQSINSAFVIVRDCFVAFRSSLLLYRVCGFEGDLDVCVLEKVGDLSDYGTVVGECGPFFGFCQLCPWEFCICFFSFSMWCRGKLFLAMERIIFHSAFFL